MFRISGDLLPPLDAPSEYFTRAATLRIIMYKCRLKYSAEIWREGHNTLILQTYWLTYLMILWPGVMCEFNGMWCKGRIVLLLGKYVEYVCFLGLCTFITNLCPACNHAYNIIMFGWHCNALCRPFLHIMFHYCDLILYKSSLLSRRFTGKGLTPDSFCGISMLTAAPGAYSFIVYLCAHQRCLRGGESRHDSFSSPKHEENMELYIYTVFKYRVL